MSGASEQFVAGFSRKMAVLLATINPGGWDKVGEFVAGVAFVLMIVGSVFCCVFSFAYIADSIEGRRREKKERSPEGVF